MTTNFTLTGGVVMGLGAIGPGIGVGYIGGKAVEAIGKNPQMTARIVSIMILAMAFTEAIAIYALIFALQ
ncbi:MAG: ATP synthase F0 subunit C [Patescibacteria group bacterium]|jgi:F-type H+-transporting ATPase subunit c